MSSSGTLAEQFKSKSWSRDGFLISTDPSLIPISTLSSAFDSPTVYWAKALPESVMRDMVDNSLCFALYTPTPIPHTDDPTKDAPAPATGTVSSSHNSTLQPPSSEDTRPSTTASTNTSPEGPTLIGFARAITDYVTFLYLTDVYVLSEWQGQGLGSWLAQCVQEVCDAMPHLRRSMLITSNDGAQGIGMYERRMGMKILSDGRQRRRGSSIVDKVVGGLGIGDKGDQEEEEESGGLLKKQLIVMSARGPGSMLSL